MDYIAGAAMGFVVRTDVNLKPAWLKRKPDANPNSIWQHDTTEDASEAEIFATFEEADDVACNWSDVPGVWRVAEQTADGFRFVDLDVHGGDVRQFYPFE